jgi:hypothetical protein
LIAPFINVWVALVLAIGRKGFASVTSKLKTYSLGPMFVKTALKEDTAKAVIFSRVIVTVGPPGLAGCKGPVTDITSIGSIDVVVVLVVVVVFDEPQDAKTIDIAMTKIIIVQINPFFTNTPYFLFYDMFMMRKTELGLTANSCISSEGR